MGYSFMLVINFFLLAGASYYIRHRYLHDNYSATGSASLVMALAMFTFAPLLSLPLVAQHLAAFIVLELVIIWALIAESHIRCYLDKHAYIHSRQLLNRFQIGTWVISTNLLALLWVVFFPELDQVAWIFALIALFLGIEYTRSVYHDLLLLSRAQSNLRVNGLLLLSSISLASFALVLSAIFKDKLPMGFSILLITMGIIFYLWSVFLISKFAFRMSLREWILDFGPAQTLIYGAAAFIGISLVQSTDTASASILSLWYFCFFSFSMIESVAIFRVGLRSYLHKTPFIYDATQWLRIFSWAVFFKLTVLIAALPNFYFKLIATGIVTAGPYIILGAMLFEIFVFMHSKFKPALKKRSLSFNKGSH